MPFPHYLIGISDIRFPKVWEQWAFNIMLALEHHAPNYAELMEFEAISLNKRNPKIVIQKYLHKMVRTCKETVSSTYWLGIDSDEVNYHQLLLLLASFNAKRRRKDYTIYMTSAFAITAALSDELLDYQIPRLNIVAITYEGTKEIIGGFR